MGVSIWRHIRAAGILPGNATFVIPLLILYLTSEDTLWVPLMNPNGLGLAAYFIGLGLLIYTNILFHNCGEGTLAPFDPPNKFVATRIYQYQRNPMISGVFLMLIGESLVFQSWYLFGWFIFFVIAQNIFIIFFEEPELKKKFGADYIKYENMVPRWIPRLSPGFQKSKD